MRLGGAWCLCACTTGVASTCNKQVLEDEGRVSAEVFKLEREIREDHLDGLPGGLVIELRVEIGDTEPQGLPHWA